MDDLNSIELNNIIAGKKPITQQAYKREYKRLTTLLGVDNVIDLKKNVSNLSIKTIIKKIKDSDFSTNTKKGLFNMLVMIFQKNPNFKSQQVKVESEREKMQNKIGIERIDKNKELLETLPAQKTIDKELNELYKNNEYLKYIINYLIITYNVRNKDLCLKIVSSMKQTKDTEFNYLVITEKYVSFIRNVYKTVKTHGKKDNRVQSKKFRNALLNYINEVEGEDDVKEDGLIIFKDSKGDPVNCNNLGYKIKKVIMTLKDDNGNDINLNETKLNKIKVKEINDKPNTIKGLEKMKKNRGTNLNTIAEYYSIDI
tara:strand:- start:42 stop:980 length:939 start_codon:yes stop_codon:yes gene_type:complete